jgi:hypothetical protein
MLHTRAVLGVLALSLSACAGGNSGPSSPSDASPLGAAALLRVEPAGGTSNVAVSAALSMHFGAPMAAGTEQYFDLHHGSLAGPTVPMNCTWGPDRSSATCTHDPLQPGEPYMLHLGSGMTAGNGQPCDLQSYGPGMGGQVIDSTMMNGGHGGPSNSMMGSGAHHGNTYGMAFPFTTAP